MVSIQVERVSKRLGSTLAVDRAELEVRAGELYFLLGPSGCGKTTLLNLIAGLLDPSEGRILFDGRDVTRLPTHERNAVMCFQSYALWPHLSVAENVRFGLDVRRLDARQREARIQQALDLVRMSAYRDRKPTELSGGQQQRIAIARAILQAPDYLLLDEASAALDEASEAAVYTLLHERLPNAAIVSIGHRSTLAAFHKRRLTLAREGERYVVKEAAFNPGT